MSQQRYPVTAPGMVELQSSWKGQQAIGMLWFIQHSEGMAYSPSFSQGELSVWLSFLQV